ncbi:hypothetical protein AX16_004522 [Volvariella volvacea WC 439]|nr:hypothetical protein AX16_004522 [Volvariella volvacea WC 439]
MEKLNARLNSRGSSLYNVDDEALRMKARPHPTLGAGSSPKAAPSRSSNSTSRSDASRRRAGGKASAGLAKSSPLKNKKTDDYDSPDELDTLSSQSSVSERPLDDVYVDKEGKRHEWHSSFRPNNTLKNLKFKKNGLATPPNVQGQSGDTDNDASQEKTRGAGSATRERPRPRPINLQRAIAASSSQDADSMDFVTKETPRKAPPQPRPFPMFDGDPPSASGLRSLRNSPSSSDDDSPRSRIKPKSSTSKQGVSPSKSPTPPKQPKKPAAFPLPPPSTSSPQSLASSRSQLSLADDISMSTNYIRGKQSKLDESPIKAKSAKKASPGTNVPQAKPQPFPMDLDKKAPSPKRLQPFPMSNKMLDSIGSSSKDLSPGKKRKMGKERASVVDDDEEDDWNFEEDSLFISTDVDPRTLCPFCDAPLPDSPSPLLRKMLAETAKKSHPDPRPGNPLGRRAPSAVFVTVCHRHQFESQILPEAEAKGWPKTIDWERLKLRVERMKDVIRMVIWEPQGARSQCLFWKELMEDVKNQGAIATTNVHNQFNTFKRAQPGYYGELGSVIILQTLCNMFPPTSLDPALTAPLSVHEFMQRVLVPEVGIRLIMQDKRLKGETGVQTALEILRESSTYGVTMFPEGGGEWDEGHGLHLGVDKLGVADRMIMERARKRRKELEDEEDEEDELNRRAAVVLHSDSEEATPRKPKRGYIKSKADEEGSPVPASSSPAPGPRRPKPRPVGKAAKSAPARPKSVSPPVSQPEVVAQTTRAGSHPAVRAISVSSASSEEKATSLHRHTLPPREPQSKLNATKIPKARKARQKQVENSDEDMDLRSDGAASVTSVKSTGSFRTPVKTRSHTTSAKRPVVDSYNSADDPVVLSHREHSEAIPEEPTPRPRRSGTNTPAFTSPSAFNYPLQMVRERAARKSRDEKHRTWSYRMKDTIDIVDGSKYGIPRLEMVALGFKFVRIYDEGLGTLNGTYYRRCLRIQTSVLERLVDICAKLSTRTHHMPRSRSINATNASHLLKRASRSFQKTAASTISRPGLRIPLEVVDKIIQFMTPTKGWGKADFKALIPLLLTSQAFRFLTLRRLFEHLRVESATDWKAVFRFLSNQDEPISSLGLTWIRRLEVSSRVLFLKPSAFPPLSRLRTLKVDCSEVTLGTQIGRLKMLADRFSGSPTHLVSLTLTNLVRIDVLDLRLLAQTFPALVDLSLSCTERIDLTCCWICYEESLELICHSPLHGRFANVEDLANSFGDALSSLMNLTRLHIGIFLSDQALVYMHKEHSDENEFTSTINEKAINCSACVDELRNVRMRETTASLILGKLLSKLQTISWSSFYGDDTLVENCLETTLDHDANATDGINALTDLDESEKVVKRSGDVIGDTKIVLWRLDGRISARRVR